MIKILPLMIALMILLSANFSAEVSSESQTVPDVPETAVLETTEVQEIPETVPEEPAVEQDEQEKAFYPLDEWTYEVGTEAIGFLYRFTVKGCAVWQDASTGKNYFVVTQDVENIGQIGTAATPALRLSQNRKELESTDFNAILADPPQFGVVDVDEWIKLTDPQTTDGYAFPMTQFGYAPIGGFGKSAQIFELKDLESDVELVLVVGDERISRTISISEVRAFMDAQ